MDLSVIMNQGSSGLKEPCSSAWINVAFVCLTERPDRLWGSPGGDFLILKWPEPEVDHSPVYIVLSLRMSVADSSNHAVMKQVETNLSSRYTKEES